MAHSREQKGQLYVGTSGWSYGWEAFYPADLPSREYLSYYSQQFRTVEVNYSFYHLPRPSTYENWAARTPRDFTFAVKLSKFITHVKRLSGVDQELEKFLANATALGPKLGPILIQLPPSLSYDPARLSEFLTAMKAVSATIGMERPLRLATEFRHRSWFDTQGMQEVLPMLTSHGAAFVLAHSNRFPYPEEEPVTSDFMYLRFHGPERMFASQYGRERLMRWVPSLKRWVERGLDVYVYFNNDMSGYAIADARETLELLRAPAR